MRTLRLIPFSLLLGATLHAQSGSGAVAPVVPVTPASPTNGASGAVPSGQTVTAAPVVLPSSVIPPSGLTVVSPSAGETAITLDIAFGIRAVPASRVTVPVGETLLITGPSIGGRPVQWIKDGRPIPNATGTLLALQSVTSADAGTYHIVTTDNASSLLSQSLILGVGPADRLLNLSTRGTLAAGTGQSFTAGFVVAAGPTQSKKLILRAVGPTLAAFGISNPLRAPVLRIFDSAGKPYVNGYAYPALVGALNYDTDLANSLAKTGAFPIPGDTLDALVMMPFPPGAYTAQITSGDNTAGNVLVEIYEVP